jgi:NitT/TauT family transport system substrate-binding protein
MKRSTMVALTAGALAAPAAVSAQSAAIRLACYTTDAYAEPFYAQELGYFARAGLNVDVSILANAASNAQMVASDAIDVCLGDPIQVAHPVNAGVPLMFFAGGSLYTTLAPTTLFVVATDSAMKTAKDFEGQTVAVIGLASISSLAVREWLRQGGADVERVKLVELPFSAMASAVQRGTVAGAFLAEPFLSAASSSVRVLAKAYDAISKSFAIATFFAKRDWLTRNRDAAHKLVGVIYDAARWANGHQSESAEILAKYSKIDVARVRGMTRVSYATALDSGQLQPILDVALKYNQLEKRVDARELIARP